MMQFLVGLVVLFFSVCASCMTITKAQAQKTVQGPAEYFTGKVSVTPLFQASEPAKGSGARVEFTPGARSNWHTHPMGQTLIVTKGEGRIQAEGEPVQIIREGDVIWTPPGQKHWHGASQKTGMTHLAIQENKEGKVVEWMERVTDEVYQGSKK